MDSSKLLPVNEFAAAAATTKRKPRKGRRHDAK
jgi:hypothetical protein